MGKITDEILKAIDLIVDEKIKKVSFYRIPDGKIVSEYESGYVVAVEGKKIHIKSSKIGLKVNDTVKVCFPQNNAMNAFIVADTELIKRLMG